MIGMVPCVAKRVLAQYLLAWSKANKNKKKIIMGYLFTKPTFS